ncbi:MAG: anti-sigma factor antagonist [Clostridia bacterium]|nr:anti-sigma factor antagonist [Clostridia bacterium]
MDNELKEENESKIIELSGRITSTNASEIETLVLSNADEKSGMIIDVRNLEFISSAGLRVLLKAKKLCGKKPFKIINANEELMNIFDMTGFSEIMEISKSVRSISVDGCEKIGSGACGEVFRLDDETIVKLYYPRVLKKDIEQEKALSKKAFVLGIPTAISYDIVDVDGRVGVVYELLNAKTLAELIRSDEKNLEKYVQMYADVCRLIHSTEDETGFLPSFKDLCRDEVSKIHSVTEEERNCLFRFIDLLPEEKTCVHGDLNINNIMVQNGECCLIDMGEFSVGTPMHDISRIIFSMDFASDGAEFNQFFKMPQTTVDRILELFLKKYFKTDSLEEAEKENPDVKWLYPLAWFRCCTAFLKSERWPKEKKDEALTLLHEKLIPFVESLEK